MSSKGIGLNILARSSSNWFGMHTHTEDTSSPKNQYPECYKDTHGKHPHNYKFLDSKLDLGIAISGGGQRAATLTLGWIRALKKKKIWDRARYVSVNSGSSWVTLPAALSAYSRAMPSFEDVLGSTDENAPHCEKCAAFKKLNYQNGAMQAQLNKASMLGGMLSTSLSWARSVSENYFNCNEYDHIHNLHTKSYADLYHKALNHNHRKSAKLNHQFPYVIVNATIINNIESAKRNNAFIPFEFTFLYCGVPVDPVECVKAFPLNHSDSPAVDTSIQGTEVPPGFITPCLFNMSTPGTSTNLSPSISDISAMSSSAIVEMFYEMYNGSNDWKQWLLSGLGWMVSNGLMKYRFNPVSNDSTDNHFFTFADGGCVDNSAIIALLRRKVKYIIACDANNSDVLDTRNTTDAKIRDFAVLNNADYMALFGCATLGSADADSDKTKRIAGQRVHNYNKFRQVFEEADWDTLMDALQSKRGSDEALFHEMKMKTVANPYLGVEPYEVTVLFVFNSAPKKMDEELPKEFQSGEAIRIAEPSWMSMVHEKSIDKNFPYISVTDLNYDDPLVALMAFSANWSMERALNHCMKDLDESDTNADFRKSFTKKV